MQGCQIIGTGPQTIVLLHGFCENSTCFNEQVFLLKDRFTIVCIDLPGFGKSASVVAGSMDDMALYVYNLLASIKVANPIMFGHSMGGYVALAFAKKYGEVLKGIGLVHSTAFADSEERIKKREQAISFIRSNGTAAYVSPFIPPLFHPDFSEKARVDQLINEAKEIKPEALINALEAMRSRPDSTEWLMQTALPVCFIAGAHDSLIPAKDMAGQATLCNQSFFNILEKSAHMGMIEESELCSRYITQYCEALQSK